MSSNLLGQTVAQMMDWHDRDDQHPNIVAVGIAAVVEDNDGNHTIKIFCSDSYDYQQIGIFQQALDLARGIIPGEDDE